MATNNHYTYGNKKRVPDNNRLNANRSNDGNSGSPPTSVENETGLFRGGVAEENSKTQPDDHQHKIPDD